MQETPSLTKNLSDICTVVTFMIEGKMSIVTMHAYIYTNMLYEQKNQFNWTAGSYIWTYDMKYLAYDLTGYS